ncbi:MAG: sensor histidine kinase KdpD [Tepidiformaceae bacterium]
MKGVPEPRPDPDLLLKRLQREATSATRGHLRLYVGAAPGVGKTYAMLGEGHRRRERGTDVVIGFVETYDRPLTMEAVEGLELIPRRIVSYEGVTLEEMDTAAVLARHPTIALVDELAHTNAPGSPNEKRYQDVEQLLAAGINVISTLNIQHLESLNDIVASITGIRVRETVPDRLLNEADEVELVDVSPQALRSRMRHGNIYPPHQAEQALANFFREGNLGALRQLALQSVAREVEEDVTEYMHDHGLEGWQTGDRVLVLLDNRESSEIAVRRAWRLAHAFGAELIAAYPEPLLAEQGMTHILTVATDLNATLVALPGGDLVAELAALVRERNVSNVTLVAEPARHRLFRGKTLAERLLELQPQLQLHLISGH